MGKPKNTKEAGPSDSLGLNWVECDLCGGWEIFENTGISGPFSAGLAKKIKYVCRFCSLSAKIEELGLKLNKISSLFDQAPSGSTWSDIVQAKDLASTKDEVNKILVDSCSSIQNEIKLIKVDLAKAGPSSSTNVLSAPQLSQATSEMLDVESRKLNVVG